jgi:hypothetical protein
MFPLVLGILIAAFAGAAVLGAYLWIAVVKLLEQPPR